MEAFLRLIVLLFSALIFSDQVQCQKYIDSVVVDDYLNKAYNEIRNDDFLAATQVLLNALEVDGDHVELNALLGSVYVKMNDYDKGSAHLSHAVELSKWTDPPMIANYIESLRGGGYLEKSSNIAAKAIELFPSHIQVLYNSGLVARDIRDYESCIYLMSLIIEIDPTYYLAWDETIEAYNAIGKYEQAETFSISALNYFKDSKRLHFLVALSKHHQNKLDDAIDWYEKAILLESMSDQRTITNYHIYSSLGAANQALGRTNVSEFYYQKCMPFHENDAGIRNNYGALLGTMGRKEEEMLLLQEALLIDPYMEMALTNLGGYFQDEGDLNKATDYFNQAIVVTNKKNTLKLRIILMLSPVSESWEAMIIQRNNLEKNLLEFILTKLTDMSTPQYELDASLDRIHFYLVYHGLNDRYLQELIVIAYQLHIKKLSIILPDLLTMKPYITDFQYKLMPERHEYYKSLYTTNEISKSNDLLNILPLPSLKFNEVVVQRKVRIGFISKFFGIFEPHGMLLDGIMKSLPRLYFHVIGFAVARTDGKPLSPSVKESCDELYETSLSHDYVINLISSLKIDILIFADTMSEPLTHFLAHSRLALIQVS